MVLQEKNDTPKWKIVRNFVFSKTPLQGHYRFEDEFQIFPCDFEKAPKSNLATEFPLVLEFRIDENSNANITEFHESVQEFEQAPLVQNIFNTKSRICRLLTSLTNHHIYCKLPQSNVIWGTTMTIDGRQKTAEESDNTRSQIILEGFYYPEQYEDLSITVFSEPRHSIVSSVDHINYNMKVEYFENPKKHIVFPDALRTFLLEYYQLDSKSRKIADAVAFQISNGVELKKSMRSLSFLSFISAIETLVNFRFKKLNKEIEFECNDCKSIKKSPWLCKCGKPVWAVTRKFRNFLKTYVSHVPNSVNNYTKLYNLRSDIIHEGNSIIGDEELDWSFENTKSPNYELHLTAMQLARIAFAHWLLYGNEKPIIE